jgi:hypothetical protein
MITYENFIAALPEFSDTAYAQGTVNFWIEQAKVHLNEGRLGRKYDLACIYFVAHHVALTRMNERAAKSGGAVGMQSGQISSKSVGAVSVSYDTSSVSMSGAGEWNATAYGRKYFQLVRGAMLGGVYAPNLGRPMSRI